jgi:hypothetical protein
MLPINNSDTAWLIVSDYNQDNNLLYNDLREDVLDPNINNWIWDWTMGNIGGMKGRGVGGLFRMYEVGSNIWEGIHVGGNGVDGVDVGGSFAGQLVGGYDSNQ